jgi:prepilin-type N-terminal cleavage/methylation domain-containing protein
MLSLCQFTRLLISFKFMKKGFTLIELLVVIGVLAIIAAGVAFLINPQDKLLQANDAKVQNDIGQLATALQSYAAQHNGAYPSGAGGGLSILVTNGEITQVPVPPTAGTYGAAYGYLRTAAPDVAVVYSFVLSRKFTSKCAAGNDAYWYWNSSGSGVCGFCGAPGTYPTTFITTCSFR